MQVGDLVRYRSQNVLGVVLRTPQETGNGDFEVCFTDERLTHTMFCRDIFLEVVK